LLRYAIVVLRAAIGSRATSWVTASLTTRILASFFRCFPSLFVVLHFPPFKVEKPPLAHLAR
jgi:hypothetical protein